MKHKSILLFTVMMIIVTNIDAYRSKKDRSHSPIILATNGQPPRRERPPLPEEKRPQFPYGHEPQQLSYMEKIQQSPFFRNIFAGISDNDRVAIMNFIINVEVSTEAEVFAEYNTLFTDFIDNDEAQEALSSAYHAIREARGWGY